MARFFFALTFAVPVLVLPLSSAIIVSIVWGMSILPVLSYAMAKAQGDAILKVVGEHILIALVVIGFTHFVGDWVGAFGE